MSHYKSLYCKCAFPNDLAVVAIHQPVRLEKKFFPGLVDIDRWLFVVYTEKPLLEKKKKPTAPGQSNNSSQAYSTDFYKDYNVSWREKSLAANSISIINVIKFKLNL